MSEPKPVYFTGKLVGQIQNLLIASDASGEIHRIKLSRGLNIAYSGGAESGRMTLGRNDGAFPSKKETFIVEAELKKAAKNLQMDVLDVKEFERQEIGNWRLIRLSIQYGKQMELFEEVMPS